MAEPFLGEIRMASFGHAPRDWALCNGQLLPINQNDPLFQLLGTTFGGDGVVNFGLPDLRARVPIHVGAGHVLGEQGGEQAHTLTINEIPTHQHFAQGSANVGSTQDATNNVLGLVPGRLYTNPNALVAVDPSTVATVGGSQAHLNMQPFLTLSFIIALQGSSPFPD